MNLNQILLDIIEHYPDSTIEFLAVKMLNGDYAVRKQLADLVCTSEAKIPPSIILEISRWGVNDHLSQCPEIRGIN